MVETEQMALPVEVEVFHPVGCCQAPVMTRAITPRQGSHTSLSKKKNRFWHSLFGKKKCNKCLKNKSDCVCKSFKIQKCKKTEGKIDLQDGFEENTLDNTKEKQISENAQSKCNYPLISQSGVGCHLYFCIDSKRKKPQAKSKKVIIRGSNKAKDIKQHNSLNCDSEGPKVTIVCEESSTNCLEGSQSKTVQIPTSLVDSKPNKLSEDSRLKDDGVTSPKYKYDPHIEATVLRLKTQDTGDENNGQENKSINNTNNSLNNNCNSSSSTDTSSTKQCVPCNKSVEKEDLLKKQREIQDNIQEYLGGNKKMFSILRTGNNFGESYNKGSIVLPMRTNSLTLPEIRDLSRHKSKKKISFKRDNEPKSNPEDDVSNDFDSYNKYLDKRRRSSVISKGTFVRNSIVSLRKDRRHSQLERGVSLILQKLDNIEGKIAELDKSSGEKQNNITMGIVCDKKKSTVSIKFNTLKQKSKPLDTGSESIHKIVNIKSEGDHIFVTAPTEISVVKKKQQSAVDPRDVAYYNAYEMDVHTIASRCHSKPTKCRNPKIIIENESQNSQAGNYKWRRVSEELKISQMDIGKRSDLSSFLK